MLPSSGIGFASALQAIRERSRGSGKAAASSAIRPSQAEAFQQHLHVASRFGDDGNFARRHPGIRRSQAGTMGKGPLHQRESREGNHISIHSNGLSKKLSSIGSKSQHGLSPGKLIFGSELNHQNNNNNNKK